MPRAPHRPKLVIGVGLLIAAGGAVLILSPLLLGSGKPIKYIVALGIAAVCLGLSMLIHGAWDYVRGRG